MGCLPSTNPFSDWKNKDIHIMFAQTNRVKEVSPWPIGSGQDLMGSSYEPPEKSNINLENSTNTSCL
jgi:hypothetical protein